MDIEKYKFEIINIINELENLESGIFYENTNDKGCGSAKKIAEKIKINFVDLIDKIENDKPGTL